MPVNYKMWMHTAVCLAWGRELLMLLSVNISELVTTTLSELPLTSDKIPIVMVQTNLFARQK